MVSFRLKQIGLALCLMVSLLTASPAACTCSHPEEAKTSDSQCRSQHEASENIETSGAGVAVNDSCICAVDQREPFTASKSESKELKPAKAIANVQQIIPDLRFVAVSTFPSFAPEFSNNLSYSSTLRSLLPSRAPPRL